MSCCPEVDITILPNGLQVREPLVQAEAYTLQFFPWRSIQSVRYAYSRDDREGLISIWISAEGRPGAGGLSYRWRFPCGESGKEKYEAIVANLT